MAHRKVKQSEDHRLELIRRSPVHATCSCGGWTYKADLHFDSAVDATLHVDRWFQHHKKIMRRAA